MGVVMALIIAPMIGGWRQAFYITGSLGLVVAVFIYFGVKEMPRGQAEPEFEDKGAEEIGQFHFSWAEAREIFKKPTMWVVFLQGFAGNFPWNVIIFFFFGYLMTERGYDNTAVLLTMAPVILTLAAGYFIGGYLGDALFQRTNKGRILVSSLGVILGAVFLFFAIRTPIEDRTTFFVLMCLTAIFMPLSAPNVTATVYDITVPEVRSTAQAVEYFVENIGAVTAPALAGIFSLKYGRGETILWICVTSWALCFLFYLGALFTIDKDTAKLRTQMAERAKAM
jgi:predicted MFS family arabinose efflux permease